MRSSSLTQTPTYAQSLAMSSTQLNTSLYINNLRNEVKNLDERVRCGLACGTFPHSLQH